MGFLTSNRSSQPVDRALSRIKTSLMKCNPNNRPKETLLPWSKKKPSVTFCESEIEDIDLDMHVILAEGMSDDSNCMWLSSDCDSSSLLSSDISGDICQLNSWNHSLPLMKSGKPYSTLFDVQIDLSGELSKEQGVLNDQSVCCYESGGFFCDKFLENSWTYESSCTSLSTMDDLDRTGTWISTSNLNIEGSELIQLKDGVNSTYSDFSSSSCSYRGNPLSESSFSSPSSLHLTEESSSLSSVFDHDEPLFWPYNQNLYESSELGKGFLCVSPRKEKMGGNMVINELKSMEVKLSKRNSPSASGKSKQLQCGKRPELTHSRKKSATGWKSIAPTRKNYNNSQCSPSQLSTLSAQASAKLFPCNTLTKKRIKSTMKETPQLKSKNQIKKVEELPKKPLLEFEASFFHEVFIEGATIEKIVGLNEFDGHEWLNFNLSEDWFIESTKKEERSHAGREAFFLQLFGTTL